MTGALRPFADGATYRRLLYLVTAIPLGALGGAVLIAGWSLVAGLAITPAVVPALLGFRAAVGLLARAEAALAAGLLGSSARPGRWRSGGRGFWGSGRAVLADKAFWRSQAYLGLRFPVGGAVAVTTVSLLGGSLFLTGLPIYYRWLDAGPARWQIDTLQKALLVVPVGLVGLVVTVWLVGPIAAAWRGLADALLRDEAVPMSYATRRRVLTVHATVVAALVALCIVVWALTSRGSFWPVWPMLALGLPLAIHAWVEQVAERPTLRHGRAVSIHAGVTGSLVLFFVLVWAASGRGSFWPEWPALVFGSLLGVHALIAFARGRDELLDGADRGARDDAGGGGRRAGDRSPPHRARPARRGAGAARRARYESRAWPSRSSRTTRRRRGSWSPRRGSGSRRRSRSCVTSRAAFIHRCSPTADSAPRSTRWSITARCPST